MREKDIKRQVLKQLKKEFRNWRRLSRKEKKRIAKEVLQSVVAKHSINEQATDIPVHELTNTPIPMRGMIKLAEMEQFIEGATRSLLSFPVKRWPTCVWILSIKHFSLLTRTSSFPPGAG